MSLRERLAFWRQFRSQLATTGAVQPSSRFLARAMIAPLRERHTASGAALRIVEMGPGTGAVTRAIAAAMGPEDHLDCYEINPRFAAFLRNAVAGRREYRQAADRITVHCMAAEEAVSEVPVDFVICSVPLNNLPAAAVTEIFAAGQRLLAEDGTFTYFEYPVLPSLHRMTASVRERERIDAVRAIKRQRNRNRRSRLVLLNLPPARAVHLSGD